MTLAHLSLANVSLVFFVLINALRIVAYVPQMICVYRDPSGARAVSLITWAMFTLANLATATYAFTSSHDRIVVLIFGINALGCLTVLVLAARKRVAAYIRSRSFGATRGAIAASAREC